MLSHGLRTVLESIWAQTKENRRYWGCKLLNSEISTRQKKGKRSPSSTKMLPVATPLDNLTAEKIEFGMSSDYKRFSKVLKVLRTN